MATIFIRWLIIPALAWAMWPGSVCAQSAIHWATYTTADGLLEPVFDCISLTPRSELIATRLNAPLASKLDGYSITNFPAPAGNPGPISESPGGQRWALVPTGLAELKNGVWLSHPVPEISASFHSNTSRPATLEFLPVRQGSVLFLLADGLRELIADSPDVARTIPIRLSAQSQIGDFTGMAVAPDESLWISGTLGAARIAGPVRNLEPGTTWQEFPVPASLQLRNFQKPVPDNHGGVTLVAAPAAGGQKLVATFDGQDWNTLPGAQWDILHAWREPDQSVWAATTNALLEWSAPRNLWVQHEEVLPGRILDVAVEPGGAFWLATANGLVRGSLPLWCTPGPVRDLDASVDAITFNNDGALYCLAGNKLHLFQSNTHREYPLPALVESSLPPRSLFRARDGSLLLDMANTLCRFDSGDISAAPFSAPELVKPAHPLGVLANGNICFFHPGARPFFDQYDGKRFQPFTNPPPLHGDDSLATLFIARNGDLWMAAAQTVFRCHDGQWKGFSSLDHSAPESAVAFAEMADGKICCATPDEIWQFDGAKWSPSQNRFNHINSLWCGHNGEIWLASNGGLLRYCNGVWMEYGGPEGLPGGSINALREDPQGQLWAATAHGLAVFHAESETNPPRTSVRWLGNDSHRLTEGDTLNLLFGGEDKWKATQRERLLYSYQLDQQGWTPFQDLNMFTLPGPSVGHHAFQVRAMNRNGLVDPAPAIIDFTVVTPWFHEARLWVILLLGAAAALFFAALALNRHRQLVRSYAAVEQKVAERTRELEIATRELVHSQKMNALGTLAAGIAHDFNNILSIIKGSAQIIEDNAGQSEKIRTRVSRIKTVVQQGAEIVDAMLGFGRGSDSTAATCDINSVVADTIKLLGDRFLREVEVKFERAESIPEVTTSRGFVQQILLNFIFNAAEAMTGRKRIHLTTRATNTLPPDIFLPPAAAASFIQVSVQDQGAGMTPEIKARIFEPFFTTKAMSARRGTGLGLSMVYELAKKMGAGLAVQSAVDQGSTFTLILPVQGEPPAKKRAAEIPAESLHA